MEMLKTVITSAGRDSRFSESIAESFEWTRNTVTMDKRAIADGWL